VTTLVVCVDRTDDVGRRANVETPVTGHESVRSLVTEVGLADPEDSSVNSIFETLAIGQDLEAEGEEAVVAVVSGAADSRVAADRSVARQVQTLVEEHDPESAIVVIDSAEDERLVPIVESRVRVDSVDRVVVRQARDLESTYYLLKQFLADEELRQTTLVPLGIVLLVFPGLAIQFGLAVATATITAVVGLFLLYKGFNIDDRLAYLATQSQEALYAGQVSVVTYVVAAGLTLIGLFAGALGFNDIADPGGFVGPAKFAYDSVPWLAMAALAASTGRLLDELIREEGIRMPYLNLPFVAVAVGLLIRGFTGYVLQQDDRLERMELMTIELTPSQRLATFIVAGVLVGLVGVRIATWVSANDLDDPEVSDHGSGSR
jgi:putative membrane protein